ncbi:MULTISPECIES: hypothetical protein [unclassified Caballeronia]|uniref:hypothetical protein n=1 Tax=unclassified Caballeronia TaxID=2646786 RepID=UPI002866BDD8|nr:MULTISPECIES: hypothetical protein [unclassified Caballeronia]MDR5771493.1 hypothetical protein [Caballeronia sp. LZ002]MDR5805254.1 hypothetical protein [Caballeronia sp. LZ001]MDR5846929.1 hypothetical protein [Caballeronia sp. LZ003]
MNINSSTNWQNEERIAIQRVIRASNAQSMARHRARDEVQRLAALEGPRAQQIRAVTSFRVRGSR